MLTKHPRIVDRDFLRYCHSMPAPCTVCHSGQFEELHHFGSGGMGMKGSDYLVVRLCLDCHRGARKARAMLMDGEYQRLAAFYADAVELMEGYLQRLLATKRLPPRCASCEHADGGKCTATCSHVEPPQDCARDEIVEWVASHYSGDAPDEAVTWLLAWSARRAANQLEIFAEAMEEIQADPDADNVRFVAGLAIRRAGMEE